MPVAQNDSTLDFISSAKALVEGGIIKTYKEIADNIEMHKNAVHLILKGERNIPPVKYRKFTQVYKSILDQLRKGTAAAPTLPMVIEPEGDYERKYIRLLEEHMDTKKVLQTKIEELSKKCDLLVVSHDAMKVELLELKHSVIVGASIQLGFQEHWLEHFHGSDHKELALLKENIGKRAAESMHRMQQEGMEKGANMSSNPG